MNTITNDELERLKELLAKATPGPWAATSYCGFSVIGAGEKPRAGIIIQMDDENPQEAANSELIVAAVNFVRQHLATLSTPSPQGVERLWDRLAAAAQIKKFERTITISHDQFVEALSSLPLLSEGD